MRPLGRDTQGSSEGSALAHARGVDLVQASVASTGRGCRHFVGIALCHRRQDDGGPAEPLPAEASGSAGQELVVDA